MGRTVDAKPRDEVRDPDTAEIIEEGEVIRRGEVAPAHTSAVDARHLNSDGGRIPPRIGPPLEKGLYGGIEILRRLDPDRPGFRSHRFTELERGPSVAVRRDP